MTRLWFIVWVGLAACDLQEQAVVRPLAGKVQPTTNLADVASVAVRDTVLAHDVSESQWVMTPIDADVEMDSVVEVQEIMDATLDVPASPPCAPLPCATVADCDDLSPCTADACQKGVCSNVATADGTACTGGQCQAGRCEFRALSMGPMGHSQCAVGIDSNVWCWGLGVRGQLGTGNRRDHGMAVQVANTQGAVAVAGGWHANCALINNGKVRCWGRLSGIYSTGQGDTLLAKELPLSFTATAVAVGNGEICALDDSKTLHCGHEDTWLQFSPSVTEVLAISSFGEVCAVRPDGVWVRSAQSGGPFPYWKLVPDTAGAVQAQGGAWLGCARWASGKVHCWPGSFAPNLAALQDAVHLSVGLYSACAIRATGQVVCAGVGFPTPWSAPPIASLALGWQTHCALHTTGAIRCAGGPRRASSLGPQTPRRLRSLPCVDVVSLGFGGGALLTKGKAHHWGWVGAANDDPTMLNSPAVLDDVDANYDWACAASAGAAVCWPWIGAGLAIALPAKVVQLASSDVKYARLADGTLWSWKRTQDSAGQYAFSPAKLLMDGVVDVAVGYPQACAVKAQDGEVWCWSSPDTGWPPPLWAPELPQAVTSVTGAVEAAVSFLQVCFRSSTPSVACRGSPPTLHDETWSTNNGPLVVVAGLPPVVQLAAGSQHMCARTASGDVWCWGRAGAGQLGVAAAAAAGISDEPVLALQGAVELVAGGHGTCARDAQGWWWCWGETGLERRPPNAVSKDYQWTVLAGGE